MKLTVGRIPRAFGSAIFTGALLLLSSSSFAAEPGPDAELPYQHELRELEEDAAHSPKDADPWLDIASIKLLQSDHAEGDVARALLLEANEALEKARSLESRSMWAEQALRESAATQAIIAASLDGAEREEAFARARRDYLRSDEEKLLRSIDSYSPSVGWVLMLGYMAEREHGPERRSALLEEAVSLVRDTNGIRTENPEQELFLVDALIFCATLTDDAELAEGLLDQGLAIIDSAEAAYRAALTEERRGYGGDAATMARLYRFSILFSRAAREEGEARAELLAKAHESMAALFAESGSYAGYEAEMYATNRGEPVWLAATEQLETEPLYWADRALWLYLFKDDDRQRDDEAVKEALARATALGPDNELVWEAYALLVGADHYGELFGEQKIAVYSRLACMNRDDVSGWILWGDNFDSGLPWPGDREYAAKTAAVLNDIAALSKEANCPAFFEYAAGRFALKLNEKGYEDAAGHFEAARTLDRPEAADVLLFGYTGEAWHSAETYEYGKRDRGNEERLELLTRAREAFAASRALYDTLKDTPAGRGLAGKSHGSGYGGFPFGRPHSDVLERLLANSAATLDEELLHEAFLYVPASSEPQDSAAYLNSWARALRHAVYLASYYGESYAPPGGQAEDPRLERRRQLLDTALLVYPRIREEAGASPDLYETWSDGLLDRARLAPMGTRAGYLAQAMDMLTEAQSRRPAGRRSELLARCRLLFCGEVESEDIPELLEKGFTDFCLAAGLPQNTARAAQGWRRAVMEAMKDFSKTNRSAMLATLERMFPKAGG